MQVVIINTACANLNSVKYALQRLGYSPVISDNPEVIKQADKAILPGVGTAGKAMQTLAQRQLIDTIIQFKRPILGICLGMQLFGTNSEENNVSLFGLVDTPIIRLNSQGHPLPHMGWNTLNFPAPHPLFDGIRQHDYVYFVHSFAMPINASTIAVTDYGSSFSAAIQLNNIYGVQFHPEKSGKTGAQLLDNFMRI